MESSNQFDSNQTNGTKSTKKGLSAGWVVFIALAALILGGAIGYWYATTYVIIEETTVTVATESPTPSESPTIEAVLTSSEPELLDEEKAAEELVGNFYTIMKNKGEKDAANKILALFTEPELDDEQQEYDSLIGKDSVSPRLFGNATTSSYRLDDYNITETSVDAKNNITVEVKESVSRYDNSKWVWYGPEDVSATFIIKEVNGNWGIDKYMLGELTGKYSGFYK